MAAGLWQQGTRQQALARLQQTFDVVVIGGGITGAGIALEGARRGLKVLLLEQRDFAWGTSSRSSKLVHGGLRYLKQGALHLTRESVVERQQLLRDAPGLIQPQSFAFADYPQRKPGKLLLNAGLMVYDLLAGKRTRQYDAADEFLMYAPHIDRAQLRGGSHLYGRQNRRRTTGVARVAGSGRPRRHPAQLRAPARQLLRDGQQVTGVQLQDALSGEPYQVRARAVVNATGAWADILRGEVQAKPMLRPLRGSHLLLPFWRLPVAQAISFMHPADGRPVFLYPWEGVTLVGTTDLDHSDLENEASISRAEVDYLLQALQYQFPDMQLGDADILSTYAGVRPVVNTGKADPSAEGRDHVVLLENGLLTVTGGKLTTFRVIALDVLAKLRALLPDWPANLQPSPIFAPVSATPSGLPANIHARLWGRYGNSTPALLAVAEADELHTIGATDVVWAELRWAARFEGVAHLQDLLLRRTRLGLTCARGAAEFLPRIGAIVCAELGWDEARWASEQKNYLALIQRCYSVPAAI
ncbi:MAG: glycerol-3-phosphate dehydrogenase/oxidase [Chitinivorax sp.]